MEAIIIVKPVDRGMRVDYVPVSDLAKLIAATCGRKCLTKKQIKLWRGTVDVQEIE